MLLRDVIRNRGFLIASGTADPAMTKIFDFWTTTEGSEALALPVRGEPRYVAESFENLRFS
jgi:hypothetical protein